MLVQHNLRHTLLNQLIVRRPILMVVPNVQQMLQYRQEIRLGRRVDHQILQHLKAIVEVVHLEAHIVESLAKLLEIIFANLVEDLEMFLQVIVTRRADDLGQHLQPIEQAHPHDLAAQMQPERQVARCVGQRIDENQTVRAQIALRVLVVVLRVQTVDDAPKAFAAAW